MGCTSSKQARRDLRQSRSLLAAPPVAASRLDAPPGRSISDEEMKKITHDRPKAPPQPAMVKKLVPRTPTVTPPNEPEKINAWELMEGLDDITPLRPSSAALNRRSFSFGHVPDVVRPMGTVPDEKFSDDFDPEAISTFRMALAELSPRHPFFLCSPARQKSPDLTGIVRARVKVFQKRIDAKKANAAKLTQVSQQDPSYKCPPGGDRKAVLYFTSLRGIRKTFEDCCAVRMVLQGRGLHIDERDVSMHAGFKEELNELLGDEFACRRLPQVFANGKHLGGAEEVKRMHDAGELAKAVEGCEAIGKAGGHGDACTGCGDVRFVPCQRCSGSCKVFVEEDKEWNEEGVEEWGGGGGFRRCPECNENGIVKCPLCW